MQMALVFTVLTMAVTAGLSFVWISMLTPRIERNAAVALQAVARNAARAVGDGVYERSREVELLAGAEALWVHGLTHEGVRQILVLNQTATPNNRWTVIADPQGIVQVATGGMSEGLDVGTRPWFVGGLKGPYVGEVRASTRPVSPTAPQDNAEPVRLLDFSAPIRVGREVVGVLAASSNWTWANDVIESLLPANAHDLGLSMFIFDRNGRVIHAPDGQAESFVARGQVLPVLEGGRHILLADKSLAAVLPWKDGRDYLTAMVRLPARSEASDLGWHVVARVPVETAFASVRLATQYAVAVGLAASILAAVLAWLAAYRLSAHLSTIASAAGACREGWPGARIPLLHSSSEVHHLSTSLQAMTERLQRVNDETEQLVRERTRELELATKELANQARTDPMTGLLNRRGFALLWQRGMVLARRSGRPLSVIVIDIDHFKRVNDSFGHAAGDEVIKYLGRVMRQRLRASDVVARLGGEEFAAMLPDTDVKGAQAIAQALVDAIGAQPVPVVGRITVSIGVASLAPNEDGAALLQRGDEALYRAKHGGRNQVCVWAHEVDILLEDIPNVDTIS